MGIFISKITIRKFIKKFGGTNVLVFGILQISACTTQNNQIPHPYYHAYPTAQKERITEICDHVAASHFVVEKRVVYFRKIDSKDDIGMPHYNTALQDGYYFCSDPLLPKSHLE